MDMMTPLQRMIVEKICGAIKTKNLIKFFYTDTTTNFRDWRIVAPHIVGKHKSSKNITLTGWFLPTPVQVSLGHKPDWKNYLIDEIDIHTIQIMPERFNKTGKNYKANKDSRFVTIYCYTPVTL